MSVTASAVAAQIERAAHEIEMAGEAAVDAGVPSVSAHAFAASARLLDLTSWRTASRLEELDGDEASQRGMWFA